MNKGIRIVLVIPAALLLLVSWAGANPSEADESSAMVYKTPTCGCCSKWIEHLEENGFKVDSKDIPDVTPVKRMNGVPAGLASCHTAIIGGYFVEGHVPAEDIQRLLRERPDIAGLAVPRMPIGSPGMEGPNPEAYSVLAVRQDGTTTVFSRHAP